MPGADDSLPITDCVNPGRCHDALRCHVMLTSQATRVGSCSSLPALIRTIAVRLGLDQDDQDGLVGLVVGMHRTGLGF